MGLRDAVFALMKERETELGPPSAGWLTESLFSTGRLDSLQFLRLLSLVESELPAPLDDEELVLENFDTVQAIERLVARRARI